jgi:hypothetical protein
LNREGGGGGCVAPVSVDIKMPQAKLHMQTKEPAVWYSLVDTIPPVGHTASVSVHPVRLVSNGREVGTLESGVVKFREVVRDVTLTGTDAQNTQALRRLLGDMGTMSTARLNSLTPLEVTPFVLPPAGVQVMRARLEETYLVDGIGRDTVQLNGWIAVRHSAARPAEGETRVEWGTAVMGTEFVGMDLSGHSKVFGPVHITLDRTKPSEGQVGKIDIPDLAKVALLGELREHDLASR